MVYGFTRLTVREVRKRDWQSHRVEDDSRRVRSIQEEVSA